MFVPGGSTFFWEEDVSEVLNFWFWLRRQGDLEDWELRERIDDWEWVGLHAPQPGARKHAPWKGCRPGRQARRHPRWQEYLPIGEAWTLAENERFHAQMQALSSHVDRARSHFSEMEAIGVPLHVEWVMAPFGERWLVRPNLAVLGVEGSDWEGRLAALLDAARSLADALG
ncbi:MAG TPA: hypothetical protein VEK76_10025 [Candidatus Binatia bacterium]|nr:hypothetical protein [Candidatus Binatia bacterium]